MIYPPSLHTTFCCDSLCVEGKITCSACELVTPLRTRHAIVFDVIFSHVVPVVCLQCCRLLLLINVAELCQAVMDSGGMLWNALMVTVLLLFLAVDKGNIMYTASPLLAVFTY